MLNLVTVELKSIETCAECDAPMVDFHLTEGGKVSLCSRAGCKKHSIEFEDLATAMNHFYNEYEVQKFNFAEAHRDASLDSILYHNVI